MTAPRALLSAVVAVAAFACGDSFSINVDTVDPPNGSLLGGQTVRITGSGFSASDVVVTFGAVAATQVRVISSEEIVALLPPSQTAGPVSVGVGSALGFAEREAAFTYNAQPAITSVSPDTGGRAGTTQVTITGTGFQDFEAGTPIVRFGEQVAVDVTVASDTSITATTPPNTPYTRVDVTVENANGMAVLPGGFAVTGNGVFGVAGDPQFCRPGLNGARRTGLFFLDFDTLDVTTVRADAPGFTRVASDGMGNLVAIETCSNDLYRLDPFTGEKTLLVEAQVEFDDVRHLNGLVRQGADFIVLNRQTFPSISIFDATSGVVTEVGGDLIDTRGNFISINGSLHVVGTVTTPAGSRRGIQEIDPVTGVRVPGTGVEFIGINTIKGAAFHRGVVVAVQRDAIQGQPSTRVFTFDPSVGSPTLLVHTTFYFSDIESGELQ